MVVLPLCLLRVGTRGFNLWADANRLAQAQVQRELCRAGAEIRWNGYLSWHWRSIKRSKARIYDVRPRSSVGKSWTIIKDGIAIQICARNDIERRARVCHHERAYTEAMRQSDCSAKEDALADIKRRAAVIGGDAFCGIGGKTARAGCITVGVAEHIKAENGQPGSSTHVEVKNQLVLVENSAGFKLILRYRRRRKHAGKQLMDAMRMDISARERGSLCELAFNGAGELDRVRRAQRGIN